MPPVFMEMISSFVSLGETQNLSASVENLQVSRQTIRRHINELERLKGFKLFETENRQYRLTDAGKTALADAQSLIRNSSIWLHKRSGSVPGLLSTEIEPAETSWMYAQQHPLIDIWSMAPPIIKRGFEAWCQSKGQLECDAMEKVRPYRLVYRKYKGDWLLVEIGDKSAYGTWLGISHAKSELGRTLDLGRKYDPLIEYWRKPYEEVLRTGAVWYEHISVCMPRQRGEDPVPVSYQRLVAAGRFVDQQPAVLVFAARTDISKIPHMPASRIVKNRPENLMEFDI